MAPPTPTSGDGGPISRNHRSADLVRKNSDGRVTNIIWTAFTTVAIIFTVVATALAVWISMPRRSIKDLQVEVSQAKAGLEVATKPSAVDAAGKKLMRTKEALKAAKETVERQARAEGLD